MNKKIILTSILTLCAFSAISQELNKSIIDEYNERKQAVQNKKADILKHNEQVKQQQRVALATATNTKKLQEQTKNTPKANGQKLSTETKK